MLLFQMSVKKNQAKNKEEEEKYDPRFFFRNELFDEHFLVISGEQDFLMAPDTQRPLVFTLSRLGSRKEFDDIKEEIVSQLNEFWLANPRSSDPLTREPTRYYAASADEKKTKYNEKGGQGEIYLRIELKKVEPPSDSLKIESVLE